MPNSLLQTVGTLEEVADFFSGESNDPRWIVSKHVDVANFFNVSLACVRRWAEQGMPGVKGKYNLSRIVRWLFTFGPWQSPAAKQQYLEWSVLKPR